MSTSRTFHPFGKLPTQIRGMIYGVSGNLELQQMTGVSLKIRAEVLDYLYRKVSYVGNPQYVDEKLRKILITSDTAGRLRSIPSAIRILTVGVLTMIPDSWDIFGPDWDRQSPPDLPSRIVAVLGDADSLQVLTLDLRCMSPENMRQLAIYASFKFLPKTVKSLRLHGSDQSISLVMEGLHNYQLQSLALMGLSSYSRLGALLEGQKVREFELGRTEQNGILSNLHSACSSMAFLKAESLSLTRPARHDRLSDALRNNLGGLKYLSIVSRGSPDDAEVRRLVDLYFGKLKELKYLMIKLDYPAAIMAVRDSADEVRTKSVHDVEDIAWPMLSKVVGEYPGKRGGENGWTSLLRRTA